MDKRQELSPLLDLVTFIMLNLGENQIDEELLQFSECRAIEACTEKLPLINPYHIR
jgi:hypothetical protein